MHTRRNREARLGQADRRLEEPRPRQLAVLRVCELEDAQHAGNAHRAARGDGFADAPSACRWRAGSGRGARRPARSPCRRRPQCAGPLHSSASGRRRRRYPRTAARPGSAPVARRSPHRAHCHRRAASRCPRARHGDWRRRPYAGRLCAGKREREEKYAKNRFHGFTRD